MRRVVAAVVITAAAMSGCETGNDSQPTVSSDTAASDRFPDILSVDATYDEAADTWNFAVTVSSPSDTPERYADGWRVVGEDGSVYGTHTLAHDHATEQPFTRTQAGVEIPADVGEVTIEGRDSVDGFGGATVSISLQTDGR